MTIERFDDVLWAAFSAGRRAHGGINLPWTFPARDPVTCGESLDRAAFQAWRQLVPSLTADSTVCTICREDYLRTGLQAGPVWEVWGPGFRVCRRCRGAGRDARRKARLALADGPQEPA